MEFTSNIVEYHVCIFPDCNAGRITTDLRQHNSHIKDYVKKFEVCVADLEEFQSSMDIVRAIDERQTYLRVAQPAQINHINEKGRLLLQKTLKPIFTEIEEIKKAFAAYKQDKKAEHLERVGNKLYRIKQLQEYKKEFVSVLESVQTELIERNPQQLQQLQQQQQSQLVQQQLPIQPQAFWVPGQLLQISGPNVFVQEADSEKYRIALVREGNTFSSQTSKELTLQALWQDKVIQNEKVKEFERKFGWSHYVSLIIINTSQMKGNINADIPDIFGLGKGTYVISQFNSYSHIKTYNEKEDKRSSPLFGPTDVIQLKYDHVQKTFTVTNQTQPGKFFTLPVEVNKGDIFQFGVAIFYKWGFTIIG